MYPDIPPETVREMRDWLADCEWADVDADDIAEMPDAQIIDAVDRHWDGGVADFLLAAEAVRQTC